MTDSNFTNMSLQGRYEIQDRIGTGGMARVYRAYDTNLERTVAIKILHDHLADQPTFKERFIREAKFVASFNHPNIVQIHDFNIIENGDSPIYYMVMPYIPGPTLTRILYDHTNAQKRMAFDRVLAIFKDLCDSLSYAHNRGMIHRDVKPANILFNEQDRAVLTDFGIARLAESTGLTQEGFTAGTPTYMSPEQVSGLPVDARSDIYSLGIILFEMLTGIVPFNEESGVSTMLKHVHAPVPRLADHLPDIDPLLESLMARTLAKNPDDRFASVAELASHLHAILGDESELAFLPLLPSTSVELPPNQTASTRILDTPDTQPGDSVVQKIIQRHSPLSILALGIGVIGIIAALAVFSNPSPLISSATVPDEDAGVPSMTGDSGSYLFSHFEPGEAANALWPIDRNGTIKREITADGFYRFRNERTGIAATSMLSDDHTYDNAIITIEGLLEADSPPSSAYGIVFRYVDPDNYHVFAVDGAQRFSIWVRDSGIWRELRNEVETWTFNEAIQPVGNSNHLTLEFKENHFIGMVNGAVVADVVDDTIASGQVGLYLATTTSGMAGTLIDDYMVETDFSNAPSMTFETQPDN